VEHEFDRLFSLFVADRLKSMLPQPCLNFILTADANEPKLAYVCDKIASMADVYHATRTYDGEPKVAGYERGSHFVNKTEPLGGSKGPTPPATNVNRFTPETQVKTPFSKPFSIDNAGKNTPTNVRCFNCNQLGHTRKLCPDRALGSASYTSGKIVTSARVQAYAIGNTNGASIQPMTQTRCGDKVD